MIEKVSGTKPAFILRLNGVRLEKIILIMKIHTPSPYDSWTDEALVDAAYENNDRALNYLLGRYSERIHNFLRYRMRHNPSFLEDVTQSALLKTYIGLKKHLYHKEKNVLFKTWVFTVATNVFIDFCRERKRIITVSLDEMLPSRLGDGSFTRAELLPSREKSDGALLKKERAKTLHACIKKLPVKVQTMIDKRFFEGKKIREMCEELSIPDGSIKATLFRAIEKLRNDPALRAVA